MMNHISANLSLQKNILKDGMLPNICLVTFSQPVFLYLAYLTTLV